VVVVAGLVVAEAPTGNGTNNAVLAGNEAES
jgi:hypothetical protein